MKTIYNYAFKIVCIYVFTLTIFATTSFEIKSDKTDYKVTNANGTKELESKVIMDLMEHNEEQQEKIEKSSEEIESTSKEEVIVDSPSEETQEEIITETVVESNTYNYIQPVDTTSYPVLQTISGSLSHYGHDCYGCISGKTASGYDISSGNIYYTDSTFGSVRIVAAGYEYPLGTILRLTNVEENPILAIVLDRGGAIGNDKSFTLDLLAENNEKAYQLGTKYNIKIEMLRSGY